MLPSLCNVDDDKALGPLGPRIISALAPFVSTVTEDALALVLEGLSAVIGIDEGKWLTPDQVATIVQMLLVTFEKNVNGTLREITFVVTMSNFRFTDPIAMDILTESFTSIASSSNPTIYQAVIVSAVPTLVPMLAKADPWIITSTLRILRALFDEAKPGALGDGVVALLGHSLFAVMEAAKDRDLLSVCLPLGSRGAELIHIKDGVQLVSTIIRKDTTQLLSWVDPADGKLGLEKVLDVVGKLVEQDEEESGGLGIGDLLVSLYRRGGDAMNNNTALLQSLVRRLKFAKTATFAQVNPSQYSFFHSILITYSSL
jgi:importin-9